MNRQLDVVDPFDLQRAAIWLGLIVSVCIDCKQTYRTVDAEGAEGGISHGICGPCHERRSAE
jgi:hypothetical protein